MALAQSDILVLIYKTEYFIINKDYDALIKEEYGLTFTNKKEENNIQCLRMLLKALKIQYSLDYTAEVAERLYVKIKENLGLNLETLPNINTTLVIYDANNINSVLLGTVTLATYQELLDNLPQDYNKVISVKVFNEYFSTFPFAVQIYRAAITITDQLVITHNLNTTYLDVSFSDALGVIICDYEIVNANSIKLLSNTTISNVKITIIG